ncbi:hypothetical protein D3C78_1830000 [compost metagenome]
MKLGKPFFVPYRFLDDKAAGMFRNISFFIRSADQKGMGTVLQSGGWRGHGHRRCVIAGFYNLIVDFDDQRSGIHTRFGIRNDSG